MIEDTSFVIDVLRGDEDARRLDAALDARPGRRAVSAITVLELHEGIVQTDTPASRTEAALDVLEPKSVIAADRSVMRTAGRLSGELIADGREIDREDCVIGATAIRAEEPVVTRNTDHFRRIDGVTVRSY